MLIRAATRSDDPALLAILEPIIRAGETYALPRDLSRDEILAFWHAAGHEVFVAEEVPEEATQEAPTLIVGTYFVCANQRGGGAHVANAGYATAVTAQGKGVARAMCEHSLEHARARGFTAMQFNFVIASNTRAVELWRRQGFATVGTLPQAFRHPKLGLVDAFVMHRPLSVERRTWHDLDRAVRHAPSTLTPGAVPEQPGVYAWYRGGKRLYVGKAESLRDRLLGDHLGMDKGLSGSAFRRNVAEELGFGSPADIKKKRVTLTESQLKELRAWILGCELAWLECATDAAATELETKLKAEHMPRLTKK